MKERQLAGKLKLIILFAKCTGEKKQCNNMLKSLCKADALLAAHPS